MKALDRKLLRDLRWMWSQALTIALVVASGVAGFLATFSAYDGLSWSREVYYTEARFADVFATLRRAPKALERQLTELPGAAHVETGLTQIVQLDLPQVSDPVIGRLVGIDPQNPPQLNRIFLREGRMPSASSGPALEALVSEAFALARGFKPGDRLHALLNGQRKELEIVGIALSPEYVFAGAGGSPDLRSFGILWLERRALAAAYDMDGAFNQVTVRLAPGASEGSVIDGLNRLLAPYGGVSAYGRDEQMSNRFLSSEIKEQRVFGSVLPTIVLGVAAFLLNVVLSRQIAMQREQIAALKALGYDNRSIALHYVKLVLLIVSLGLLMGVGLGAWLGHWFMGIYAEVFRFPDLRYRVRMDLVLAASGLTLAAALGATWRAISATVRLAPAEAMRPPAPGRYRPSFVESWGLRAWFSPAMRMILRTMQRRPVRTLLTILGIAASMAIVINGTFWRDTIDMLLNSQFRLALRGDVIIGLVEASPSRVLQEVARLPQVNAVEGSRSVLVRLVHGPHHWRGSVQGRTAQPQLQRIVDTHQSSHASPQEGLLLTDRLAERLQLRPGQIVRVELMEGRRQVLELPIVGTVQEMMGMGAYIERRSLNHLLQEDDVVNTVAVTVTPGHEAELLERLKALPRVAMAFSKSVMLRNIEEITARNILTFSAILTVFASVIAVGVVYNHARISLAERAWELASLRVLGFTRGEVSSFLLGELALETLLAIPLGFVSGYWLAAAIVQLIKTDEFFFPLVIQPATYAYAALTVAAAGAASALIVRRRIDTLDLVGVLKTRE